MSDGFSKSRASLLVEGFENPGQLGLPKHSPAASFDSLVPTLLTLRANFRLLFLAPAPVLDCG